MIKEGVYHLRYGGSAGVLQGFFVLRAGKLAGLGELGAEYDGEYWFDEARRIGTFRGIIKVPPNIQLVTGLVTGPSGQTLPFQGESPVPNPIARFSMHLGGKAVDVAARYVRPLPG